MIRGVVADFQKATKRRNVRKYRAQGQSATNQDAKGRRSKTADRTPQNPQRATTAPPGQSPGYAQMNPSLDGRREKNDFPSLSSYACRGCGNCLLTMQKRTYTDNVSAHGARVVLKL